MLIMGRSKEKCYGPLFTFFPTRAVVKQVNSLTINSQRRMLGRRGARKGIYNDNAKNFREAPK